jgi:hypothetical protein
MTHEVDREAGPQVTPTMVEAIARRVAELLRTDLGLAPRLLTPGEVADRFAVSRTWVYEHASELGAIRLGDGPKARLRFDANAVSEVLGRVAQRPAGARESERPGNSKPSGSTSLLPIYRATDGR